MKTFVLLLSLLLATELLAGEVPGPRGAISVPFAMPMDGQVTVGIYSREGRLVRILCQLIEMPKGQHTVRWDGLDLWGNPVPAGSEYEVKVFAGPGLRAKWEFGIASPNPVPWPTKPFGEGAAMRCGGWLGDHGVSASAVAVGDRLYLGSFMAEHGHTVIYCNLEGEKMWGRGGVEGWKGPQLLASDGQQIFGVVDKSRIHRIDLSGENPRLLADTKEDEIVGFAAHAGKLVLTLKNHEASEPLVKPEISGKSFDYARCVPVPDNAKAYNRNLTGREQFATTFSDGGHPQTGITPVAEDAQHAKIEVRFTKPVTIGTLLVAKLAVPLQAEFYVLATDGSWQLFGRSDLGRPLNTITASGAPHITSGLQIRLACVQALDAKKWPRLTMCRILPKRLERTDAGVEMSWNQRTSEPLTEQSPFTSTFDLKRPTSFDVVAFLNCVNTLVAVDAEVGGQWVEIGVLRAGSALVEGSLAASVHANDRSLTLAQTVTTRSLRLRVLEGMGPGRFAVPMNTADPMRTEAADVALLRLVEPRPQAVPMLLQVRDATTGEVISETKSAAIDMAALAFAPDGVLYSVASNKLYRTELPARQTVLNDKELIRPVSMAVSPDGQRIAVGDLGRQAVLLFDRNGKLTGKIGDIGPRRKGPWNPATVEQPCAVTIDQRGKIWVCEKTYTPKRVTRYSADGKFEREFLGPPHYGGGGWLDPSLKTFWYEACEYEVDFAKGTARLKNLNDVQSDPDTPTSDGSSYSYTKVGRPIYYQGHRYVVGDVGGQFNGHFVVCLLDEGQTTWKPVAVMGNAQGAAFLTRNDKPWRTHWLKQELAGSSFIWCDLNGDGKYQIEEVQLFKNAEVMGDAKGRPFSAPYWGCFAGPDLTFWGSEARLAPTRFTQQGVPMYEKSKIQPFNYEKLAPIYMGNVRANAAAKPGYGGTMMVAQDGAAVFEGQPYIVQPDLTIKGGPVTVTRSDYQPPIAGTILDNPLSFIGSAVTKSPVGEVAMLNGDNGQWFLWSVAHSVVLGEIFTGKDGGFGGITQPQRGLDVTRHKQDWETFFGQFLRAHNGNYYVVAGRGHFGLSQVTGIDEIQVLSQPLQVSTEAFAANQKLRPLLIASANASRAAKKEKREMKLPALTSRVKNFQLDGELADWGEPGKFQKISDDGTLAFDAAWDKEFLTLAYRGQTGTGNRSEDWKYIFKTGFCFDVLANNRRIVFGQHKGKWVAVLFDYAAPNAKPSEGLDYTSPVTSTRVDRVVLLPAEAVKIAFRAGPTWTAEVQLAWSALGLTPTSGAKLRADFGILAPDSGGIQVEKRTYWSDPDTGHVADLAVEAQIHPGNWGTVVVETK